jgi:hypothetical protein
MSNLLNLPCELILLEIASHLAIEDIYNLLLTNRQLYHMLENRQYQRPSFHLLERVIKWKKRAVFRRFLENDLDAKVLSDSGGVRRHVLFVQTPTRMKMMKPLLEQANLERKPTDMFYLRVNISGKTFLAWFLHEGWRLEHVGVERQWIDRYHAKTWQLRKSISTALKGQTFSQPLPFQKLANRPVSTWYIQTNTQW